MPNHLAIAEQLIAHYNAQDADAYVSLMTDDACEANYRGAVVREGKEGTRSGLAAARCSSQASACTVLPRPMSSASTPPRPLAERCARK